MEGWIVENISEKDNKEHESGDEQHWIITPEWVIGRMQVLNEATNVFVAGLSNQWLHGVIT